MKNSLNAFMQKANSISVEDLKNSIKGGMSENCHGDLTNDKTVWGEEIKLSVRPSDSRDTIESFERVVSFEERAFA